MLRDLLAADVFHLLLVFARLGAAIAFFPGLGGAVVSVRARLLLAVAVTFLVEPVVHPQLPAAPTGVLAIAVLVATEATIGIFFSMLTQTLMVALDLAGNIIGYSIGLTNAFAVDPVTAQQSQLLTGFLNITATTLVLITDTHHLFLHALVDSYGLFTPGARLPLDDFSATMVRILSTSFTVGFGLAAPVMVFALVFNTALGLLNRLVPQMQVFFVGLPMQILGGLSILMLSLPAIMIWFMRHFREGVGAYLGPG
ncbi:MAG TPA: flagellar type III secretion system protein FliR [Rhodospirillaceae bacterium]|nr:flagellar type III secretion system protein FliR [Rhodospirillaceae bacterium]